MNLGPDMPVWQAGQFNRAISEQYTLRIFFKTTSKKTPRILPFNSCTCIYWSVRTRFVPVMLQVFFAWDGPKKLIRTVFGDDSTVAFPLIKLKNKDIMTAKDFIKALRISQFLVNSRYQWYEVKLFGAVADILKRLSILVYLQILFYLNPLPLKLFFYTCFFF